MGLIADLFAMLFGRNRNVLRETIEVFRENEEAGAQRAHAVRGAALAQFAAEFRPVDRSCFDRLMDGINRLPRPLMALGICAMFVAAMTDPIWFGARMSGLARVPEPLWWLFGVIVSFYFGARHQVKYQEFQQQIAAQAQASSGPLAAGEERPVSNQLLKASTGRDATLTLAALKREQNPALAEWQQKQARGAKM